MIRFPSIPAAILTGVVGMPLLMWVAIYIDKNIGSQFLLFIWLVIGFLIPVLVATVDFSYIREGGSE